MGGGGFAHFDGVLGGQREVPAEMAVTKTLFSRPPDLHGNHGASSCCSPEVLFRAHRVIGKVPIQEVHRQLVHVIPAGILADGLKGWMVKKAN